ncbi:MAG: hypothetical protein ABI132_11260 [Rhodanobacteraceae bacterium]
MAVVYAVVAWLLIQIAAITFPLLLLPEWLTRAVVALILIGFPVALLLAWAFYVSPEGVARTGTDAVTGEVHPRARHIALGIGVVGILIAALAGGVYWHFDRGRIASAQARHVTPAVKRVTDTPAVESSPMSPNPVRASKSIAVLPLVNLSGDPNDNYLGEGISEEVLNALTKLPGLKVIGRESSFSFRNSNVSAATIGRELDVRSLLSGTVQRTGDDLRITVELDDTKTGVQLWSQQYDRKMQGLFALEDNISGAVVKALAVTLGAAAGQPLVNVGTANPQAHDLYLRAIRLYWHTDEASLNQAIALFDQAIAEDPNYAAAWAGMAQAYGYLADAYRAPLDVLPAMRGAAEKAVALNDKLAMGHLQLGFILMNYEWDFAGAKRELERAVALNPGLAEAHAIFGLYRLRIDKDPARARDEFRIAEKLDPLNAWFPRWEGFAAIAQGDESGAMMLAQRVRRLDPAFSYDTDAVAYVDAAFGHWQACVDRYTLAHVPVSPSGPQLAICQAHVGDSAKARAVIAQLETAARSRYVDRSHVAAIHAALGEKDQAFAALEQAYHDRSVHMVSLWMSPWFEPLHGDPRFQALVARVSADSASP